MSETGVEGVVGKPKRAPSAGEPLRLLFVGRMIRTKGILDAVRAVAFAANHYTLRFDVIGDGDLLATCKEEALRLGVADLVHFHGRIPRDDIGAWYEKAHVFLFPSFREPSGNVVFEAMSYGCPVITSNRGGPGFVVDDSCGIRVEPRSPDYYVSELGTAITQIASKHSLIADLSAKALMRVNELADWGRKLQRLLHFYLEIVPTPGLNRSELGIDTSR
jgi:glycosyltransferase involved in cell wall biosynthesis